jgi:hypothetical protein
VIQSVKQLRLLLACLVALVGCHRPDPGISKEKAEAVLHEYHYVDIDIGPTSDGWEGLADQGPNTYQIQVHINRDGALEVKPAPTH